MAKTKIIGYEPDRQPGAGNCTCGMLVCICPELRVHHPDCKFLKALSCPVGIECDHGYDVCPICDPCTCAELRADDR